jgi:hypothetical protein
VTAGDGQRTGEAAAYPRPNGGRRLMRAGGRQRAKAPESERTAAGLGRVRSLDFKGW